jgi:glycerophosphoryl diester phosphodiesterase
MWETKSKIREWLPRLQAHRGYWVEGKPQNTILSIQESFNQGYKICEFDVRITSDSKVILFHDAKFKNKFISDYLFDDLISETPINTLEELLSWFEKETTDFKLNIEIKNDGVFNYEIEKMVVKLIKQFAVKDRVLISSFNPLSLAKVRLLDSKIYRALLLSYVNDHGNNLFVMSGIANLLCKPHLLHLRFEDFQRWSEYFAKLSESIPIVLWTVNDINLYNQNSEKIFGIISDEITPKHIKD